VATEADRLKAYEHVHLLCGDLAALKFPDDLAKMSFHFGMIVAGIEKVYALNREIDGR
jgi:hypothetical protein